MTQSKATNKNSKTNTSRISVSRTPSTLEEKITQEAESRDLLNQLLGQAQMADAFSKFSGTVRSSKLAFVKENKLYQSLKGKITPNGSELNGTWADFCDLLGISVDKADLDIANLKAFGEEALESMSRMGIGYRELRQYRKLPTDQQQALIEVAKDGDKESLMELAEELIAKQVKEKEALKADLEISRQALADKKEQFNRLQETNEELNNKIRYRTHHETPDQFEAEVRKEITLTAVEIESLIAVRLKDAFTTLNEHAETSNQSQADFMAGILCQIRRRTIELQEQFYLEDEPTGTDKPSWLDMDESKLIVN
ncbi:hypothetical protein MASR2M36_24780 [Providencia sp.]